MDFLLESYNWSQPTAGYGGRRTTPRRTVSLQGQEASAYVQPRTALRRSLGISKAQIQIDF